MQYYGNALVGAGRVCVCEMVVLVVGKSVSALDLSHKIRFTLETHIVLRHTFEIWLQLRYR